RKAFELRGQVSERERLQIEAAYYWDATRDLEKAVQTYELWQQIYPNDFVPYANSAVCYLIMGNVDKFLEVNQKALQLQPNHFAVYLNLAKAYQFLNRLDDAEAELKEAEARKLQGETMIGNRYIFAFLQGNESRMAQLAAQGLANPHTQAYMLALQADT